MSTKVLDVVDAGVISGEDVQRVFAIAKAEGYAIPA